MRKLVAAILLFVNGTMLAQQRAAVQPQTAWKERQAERQSMTHSVRSATGKGNVGQSELHFP
jgi:hypothetical protein